MQIATEELHEKSHVLFITVTMATHMELQLCEIVIFCTYLLPAISLQYDRHVWNKAGTKSNFHIYTVIPTRTKRKKEGGFGIFL